MLDVACFLLSCCALFALPIWSVMLFHDSLAFELPKRQRKGAGWACVVASALYTVVGLYCFAKMNANQKKTTNPALSREYYMNGDDRRGTQRPEMEPLLEDEGDSFSTGETSLESLDPAARPPSFQATANHERVLEAQSFRLKPPKSFSNRNIFPPSLTLLQKILNRRFQERNFAPEEAKALLGDPREYSISANTSLDFRLSSICEH